MNGNNELRTNIIKHYKELLEKDYKYQMGDDDFQLSTKELTIIRPLKVILEDLKEKG